MSIFKRLSATLVSQVDQVVSEIENHDAVVEAALRDQRRAFARAKARFTRLKASGRQLERRLETLREAERRWTERARSKGRADEETALKCLQRRRECQTQAASLAQALEDQRLAEHRMGSEIAALESRIRDNERQRTLMRSRESTAEAARILNAIETSAHIDVEDTFEKWEVRITEAEIGAGESYGADSLEREFLETEDLEDLKAELDDLIDGEERTDER